MIDKNALPNLKQQLGLGDKDLPSLNPLEKRRLVELARNRRLLPGPGGPAGPHNAAAGPSRGPMGAPPRMGQMHPGMQPPQPQPQQQMNTGMKRSPPSGDEVCVTGIN